MRAFLAVLLLSVACTYLWPARGEACTCLGDAIYHSEPEANARDVALNQAIVVEGVYVADSIVFEDAGGRAVKYDATLGPAPSCPGTSAELVPRQLLRADTTYVVRVRPILSESEWPQNVTTLTFTTGSSMLPERELEPAIALASMISNTPPSGFGCGSGEFSTCVTVDDFEDVEVLARRGDEIIMRWTLLDRDGVFLFESAPDCMEFRRRGPTGKRSAVVAICGEQLNERAFRPSDLKDQVIQCRNGKIGADADSTPAVPSGDSPAVTAPVAGSSAAADNATMSSMSSGATAATPTNAEPAAAGCSAGPGARGWTNVPFLALLFTLALRLRAGVSSGKFSRCR